MNILSSTEAQLYQNTSLKRGHVVFTSLIQCESKILFLDAHLNRLLRGAEFLFPKARWSEKKKLIEEAVKSDLKASKNHYVRLSIFDENLIVESREREVTSSSVKLTKAESFKESSILPSFLKQSNYLLADLELRKAAQNGFEDVVFCDSKGYLTEASSSNIFLVDDNGMIKTPPTSGAVLEGITGEKLSECLRRHYFIVRAEALTLTDLEKAREIWLTNAVKGVRFVSQFQDKNFSATGSIYEKACALFGRYGENYE